jgi:MFS family permease
MLPVALVGWFMAQFDFFVVNVAAPSLRRDLHASEAAIELIVAGYVFTYAAGMITGGRLGDLFGHRRMFIAGMSAFAAASCLCGLAPSAAVLIAARLLQGLTGALMVPQVLGIIGLTFPVAERGRAIAWYGAFGGVGALAGQVLGGVLLQANLFGLGWRAIFLINIPIGVVTVVLALRLIPRGRQVARPHFDPLGALGVSAALAAALIPLTLGREAGWPLWCWVSLAGSVPLLVLTLRWERSLAGRGGAPILDVVLLRTRAFALGLGANAAFNAYFAAFMFTLTLLLQTGLGLSARQAGLAFAPMGTAFVVTALIGRRLNARYGFRPIVGGAFVSTAAVAGVGLSAAHPALLPAVMLFVGGGNGFVLPSLIGIVAARIEPSRAGAAAGVLTTTQQFAGAAGITVIGTVFFAAAGPGLHAAMAWSAGICDALVLFVIALVSALARMPGSAAATPAEPKPVVVRDSK